MPIRTPAQRLGDAAEALVAARLQAGGWRVVARNLRLGRDEIDLLAVDPGPPIEVVVVEVRWRSSRWFGMPEETVRWDKRRRLRRAVGALIERLPAIAPELAACPVRVDLVTVEPGSPGPAAIVRHHRSAEV